MRNSMFFTSLLKNLARMLVPILILGVLLYDLVGVQLGNMIAQNNASSLQQTMHITRQIFQAFDTANLLISSDSRTNMSLRRVMKGTLETDSTDIKNISTLSNALNSIIALNPYIDSIYIIIDSADRYYSTDSGVRQISSAPDSEWIHMMQGLEEEMGITSRRIHRQFDLDKNRNLISVYRRIFSWMGTVVVNINIDKLQKDMSEYLLYDGQLMFLSDGHTLLPLTDDRAAGESTAMLLTSEDNSTVELADSSYLVSRLMMDRFNWSFLSLAPTGSIGQAQADIFKVVILFVVICLFICVLMAFNVTHKNLTSIEAIFNAFEYADRGEEMALLGGRGVDQYNRIISGIIQNGIRRQALHVQMAEEKYQMKALELTALRYQINPHFVSNTLKTIYWKSVNNSGLTSPLSLMIENFLDVVHYTLTPAPNGFTTLKDEISHTQSFCDIIAERHNGKCEVQWDVPPEVLAVPCPKLILQPYVENAFYHGIHSVKTVRKIWLRFKVKDGIVTIYIANNGICMDPETLAAVQQSLESDKIPERHIGMFNPHRRIRITYGPQYGIRVFSKDGYGTCVLIRFPMVPPSE